MSAPRDSETIASTVRQRRKQRGLSQAIAASRAGISRRAWSEIELGQRRGSDETLAAIDTVLGFQKGTLAALDHRPRSNELAEIRRELIEMINLLATREELEQARFDMTRRRFFALRKQLDEYEARLGNDESSESIGAEQR